MAEELGELINELLPLTTPLMIYMHRHFLRHFVEQDLIATVESELEGDEDEMLGELHGRDRLRRPRRLRAVHGGGGRAGGARPDRAVRGHGRGLAARERARGQEHRRRGDDRRQRPGRADGLGDRLPGGLRAALAAADRDPLRPHDLPRRRLLRPQRQPRRARRGARARGRGARDRAGPGRRPRDAARSTSSRSATCSSRASRSRPRSTSRGRAKAGRREVREVGDDPLRRSRLWTRFARLRFWTNSTLLLERRPWRKLRLVRWLPA